MAIDDVVQTYNRYVGQESLPEDLTQLDRLVKYAVGKLNVKPRQSKKILLICCPASHILVNAGTFRLHSEVK